MKLMEAYAIAFFLIVMFLVLASYFLGRGISPAVFFGLTSAAVFLKEMHYNGPGKFIKSNNFQSSMIASIISFFVYFFLLEVMQLSRAVPIQFDAISTITYTIGVWFGVRYIAKKKIESEK